MCAAHASGARSASAQRRDALAIFFDDAAMPSAFMIACRRRRQLSPPMPPFEVCHYAALCRFYRYFRASRHFRRFIAAKIRRDAVALLQAIAAAMLPLPLFITIAARGIR